MAAKPSAGVVGSSVKQSHLAALDPFDDRHQQILARPEVVQQHSVAGADRGSDLAQRPVADAARGEFLDQRVE